MKALLPALSLFACTVASAEPAVYREQTLTLPRVLVQQAAGPALYADVELQQRPDGSFAITAWEERAIAGVESIAVESDQYPPGTVIVLVEGFKSLQCVELGDTLLARTGNTFHFVIEELEPPANVRCLPGAYPFSTEFGIVTTDLEPGDYRIEYGELYLPFTLHAGPRP